MLNVQTFTKKALRVLAGEGIAPLCRQAMLHLSSPRQHDPFAIENGAKTIGLKPLWKIIIGLPNARHGRKFVATSPEELVSALEYLDVDPASFTFIDLGCGERPTLIVAVGFRFCKVIIVDLSEKLVTSAHIKFSSQGLDDAVILQIDVANFNFPERDNVIHLYNLLFEWMLTKVLDNLHAVRDDRLYIVYESLRRARLLDGCDFLQRYECAPWAPHISIWRGVIAEARMATGAPV